MEYVDGKTLDEVLKAHSFLGCAWTDQDRDLVCALRQKPNETTALWRIQTERPSTTQILPFSEGASHPQISLASRRLLFDRFNADTNIWRAPDPGYNRSVHVAASQFISSTQREWEPLYSPDGSRIAFLSLRSGQAEIWVARENGSETRMLTTLGEVDALGWSPDGISIIFARKGDIYVVDSLRGFPKQITCEPPVMALRPCYSPDGLWIYFACDRSGSRQIWRMPAGRGSAVQLTTNGEARVIGSADGRLLLYTKIDRAGTSLTRSLTWRLTSQMA